MDLEKNFIPTGNQLTRTPAKVQNPVVAEEIRKRVQEMPKGRYHFNWETPSPEKRLRNEGDEVKEASNVKGQTPAEAKKLIREETFIVERKTPLFSPKNGRISTKEPPNSRSTRVPKPSPASLRPSNGCEGIGSPAGNGTKRTSPKIANFAPKSPIFKSPTANVVNQIRKSPKITGIVPTKGPKSPSKPLKSNNLDLSKKSPKIIVKKPENEAVLTRRSAKSDPNIINNMPKVVKKPGSLMRRSQRPTSRPKAVNDENEEKKPASRSNKPVKTAVDAKKIRPVTPRVKEPLKNKPIIASKQPSMRANAGEKSPHHVTIRRNPRRKASAKLIDYLEEDLEAMKVSENAAVKLKDDVFRTPKVVRKRNPAKAKKPQIPLRIPGESVVDGPEHGIPERIRDEVYEATPKRTAVKTSRTVAANVVKDEVVKKTRSGRVLRH